MAWPPWLKELPIHAQGGGEAHFFGTGPGEEFKPQGFVAATRDNKQLYQNQRILEPNCVALEKGYFPTVNSSNFKTRSGHRNNQERPVQREEETGKHPEMVLQFPWVSQLNLLPLRSTTI